MYFEEKSRQINIDIGPKIELKDYNLGIKLLDSKGAYTDYTLTVNLIKSQPLQTLNMN